MYSKMYTTCFLFCGKPSNTISQPEVLQSIYPSRVVDWTEVCMFHNLATAQPNHTKQHKSTFLHSTCLLITSYAAVMHTRTMKPVNYVLLSQRDHHHFQIDCKLNPQKNHHQNTNTFTRPKKSNFKGTTPQTKDLVKDCHCESVPQSKATLCSQAALCSPLTRVSLRARPHFAHHSQECPSEQGRTLLTTHKSVPQSKATLCSPLTRVSLRARPHFAHHSQRMSLRVRLHFAHHSQECPSEWGHTLLTRRFPRARPHFAYHSQECPSEQGHTFSPLTGGSLRARPHFLTTHRRVPQSKATLSHHSQECLSEQGHTLLIASFF